MAGRGNGRKGPQGESAFILWKAISVSLSLRNLLRYPKCNPRCLSATLAIGLHSHKFIDIRGQNLQQQLRSIQSLVASIILPTSHSIAPELGHVRRSLSVLGVLLVVVLPRQQLFERSSSSLQHSDTTEKTTRSETTTMGKLGHIYELYQQVACHNHGFPKTVQEYRRSCSEQAGRT